MRGTACERGYEIYPVRPSNENFLTYIIFTVLRFSVCFIRGLDHLDSSL